VPHVAQAIAFLLGLQPCGTGVPPATGIAGGTPAPQLFAVPAPWGIYNVTNRGETTWCGFAREIVRLAGSEVPVEPITTAEFGAPAPRPTYSVLDTAAYHRLGGPAMPDWKEALGEYFEELKQVEGTI
jgi:dTDP-4-dehydrorhamnose reductase